MDCAPFLLNAVHSHTMFVPRPKSVTSRTYDRKAHESTAKKLPTVIHRAETLLKGKIQKLLKSQFSNSRTKYYAFPNARGGPTNNVQIVKKYHVRGESR